MPSLFLLISDAPLREAVAEQIKAHKFGEARIADSIAALAKLAESEKNAVVVVDEAALDKKNTNALAALAALPEKPAILVLGGASDGGENEHATESFAKPLRLGHLLTRLRYYLETAPLLRDRVVAFGPYRLEPQNRRLLTDKNPEPIRLTEKETALLLYLAHRDQPATRRDILAEVWGYDENIDTHTLETHIYQLRRKLEDSPGGENWLINEAGAYRLMRGDV